MKPLKVLHLPRNIASQLSMQVEAMNMLGHKAKGVAYKDEGVYLSSGPGMHLYQNVRSSRSRFSRLKWAVGVLRALKSTDVAHFHYETAFLQKDSDLKICSQRDIPRFIEFWGSELRRASIWKELVPSWQLLPEEYRATLTEQKSLDLQKRFADYGYKAISTTWMLEQCIDREMFNGVVSSRSAVKVDSFECSPPSLTKKRPLVVHFPSNPKIKGSEFICKAVELLQKKRDFDFELVTGKARAEALAIVAKADVVIDQVLLGEYGLASVEAMAMGKPVMCYLAPEFIKNLPSDTPIMSAYPDPTEIAEKLDLLLSDAKYRHDIGLASRKYVEDYHSAATVAAELIDAYRAW